MPYAQDVEYHLRVFGGAVMRAALLALVGLRLLRRLSFCDGYEFVFSLVAVPWHRLLQVVR